MIRAVHANFLPLDDDDRAAMLAAIGLSEEKLVPNAFATAGLRTWNSSTEAEILERLKPLSHEVDDSPRAGGGLAAVHIPTVVDSLTSRGEFVTAYTPYQPECSQGTLESIFEFQTRICELTGLDISNAGLYDGSTALVEAVTMAVADSNRQTVLVSRAVHPSYRAVLSTLTTGLDIELVELPFSRGTGLTEAPTDLLTDDVAAVVIQSPNAFGLIEKDIESHFSGAGKVGAAAIQIYHPLSVPVCGRPGDLGADIAVAEGQPLGVPLWGGGPYVGLFSARERFLRLMPGRIAGKTTDQDGKDCWVLTLQTREQHIRRERATSNICTNQALIALRVTIFLAAMGWDGLSELSEELYKKANAMDEEDRVFSGAVFNEYAVKHSGGVVLDYPELGDISLKGVVSA